MPKKKIFWYETLIIFTITKNFKASKETLKKYSKRNGEKKLWPLGSTLLAELSGDQQRCSSATLREGAETAKIALFTQFPVVHCALFLLFRNRLSVIYH